MINIDELALSSRAGFTLQRVHICLLSMDFIKVNFTKDFLTLQTHILQEVHNYNFNG